MKRLTSHEALLVEKSLGQLDPHDRRFVALGRDPSPSPSASAQGPSHEGRFDVRWCRSPLEMREHLSASGLEPRRTVLVAEFPDDELSDDLRARLVSRRLLTPQRWDLLRELFGVRDLDPRLGGRKWLVDALLELPREAFPDVRSPLLTLELAEETLWKARLGFRRADGDGPPLLRWLLAEPGRSSPKNRWLALSPNLRSEFLDWVKPVASPALPLALRTLQSTDEDTCLALGLIARLLVQKPAAREEARLEAFHALKAKLAARYLDEQTPQPREICAWADLTESYLTELDAPRQAQVLARAEAVFEDGLAPLAISSDLLLSGLEARRLALTRCLEEVASGQADALGEIGGALTALGRHRSCTPREKEGWEMAARAATWLASSGSAELPGGFAALVVHYSSDLGWLDLVRDDLDAAPHEVRSSETVEALRKQLDAVRDEINRAFSERVVEWYAKPQVSGGRTVLSEDVLWRVVAPLAERDPVLLVVLDGMSEAVHRRLQQSLEGGWRQFGPADSEGVGEELVCIPPLPTLTGVCRTSLLTGALQQGTQQTEAKLFPEHAELRTASRTKPKLFHKAVVGKELDPELRELIENRAHRVLATVVNTVDDALGGAQQHSLSLCLEDIPILQELLIAARSAARTVVLASDHGHVVDRGAELLVKGSGHGARSRRPKGPGDGPLEGEVLVAGPRVLDGPWTLAWSERVRYADRKRGYHGGVAPQELVVPLSVWRPRDEEPSQTDDSIPEEWNALDRGRLPTWWRLELEGVAPSAPARARQKTRKKATKKKPADREPLPLLEGVAAMAALPWPEGLDARAVLGTRLERHSRLRIERSAGVELVRLLHQAGGAMSLDELARKLGKPGPRTRGTVTAVQKVLNLEGYEILHVAGDLSVRLSTDLLKTQFDLDGGS